MIQSLFYISRTGEPIIEKHWRGITSRAICDFFWNEVTKYESKEEVPPILSTSKYYLISVCRDGNFLLAITTGETSPLITIEFLHRVLNIFEEYFGNIEESTIKENFSTVYQLLEEMMDYGYTFTTEPNILKAMIEPPSVFSRIATVTTGKSYISEELPDGTLSNMPWRTTGVRYSQNEIYLDIIEEIDAVFDKNGQVISIDVSGSILANSKLSGMPDLTLQFADPNVIDDCSFHQCVRYNRYDRDKVVSFVPPDGQFELMRYRVNNTTPIIPPCYCQPQYTFDKGPNNKGNISVIVGHRSTNSLIYPASKGPMVIEDVVVVIPFNKSVRTVNLVCSIGQFFFDESTKVARWTIGKITKDQTPSLNGSVLFHSNQLGNSEDSPPIQLYWKVPSASVSGLSVAGLQITNESYKPYKGFRVLTQSGKFQIRST